jgi:chromosomal replication initiator protein
MKGGKMQMTTATKAGAFTNGENALKALPPEGVQMAAGVSSDMKQDAIFERVSARLKAQVGPDVFASWFGRLKLHSVSKSLVRLSVPTTFLKSWINNRYLDLITSLFQQEDAEILKVEILVRTATRGVRPGSVDEAIVEQPAPQAQPRRSAGGPQPVASAVASVTASAQPRVQHTGPLFGSPLDPRYTFESFRRRARRTGLPWPPRAPSRKPAPVPCASTRCSSMQAVGLGKTHLLQAIAAWRAGAECRKSRVVYLTAEYFMWRFATAIRDNNALTSLKETAARHRPADHRRHAVPAGQVDPARILPSAQHAARFSAKQVVVAADRAPSELESLEPRVRSRMKGGVAIEMEAPDYEMRLEILKRRLAVAQHEDHSLDISPEILSHVARNITASGRELEGAFNQLLFRRSFEPNLTIERVDELLGHLVAAGEPRRVRIEDIQRVVAKHYNVSRQELVSNRRTRVIVKPRQIAMYLSKTLTPRSFPEIGRRFGGRDHTTVLHAVRKIEDLISGDTKLSHEIELLKRLINE